MYFFVKSVLNFVSHCNIEYKDEIYKKFYHLIYYIDNYAYEYGVFDINKLYPSY